MDQFETVLARLHSGDNSARSVGESAYADALASDPGSVVVQLVRVLRAPERSELHAMALVLLRRAVGTHWDKIAAQVRSQLGDELLALLEGCGDEHMQRQICQVIANFPPDALNQWSALVPWTLRCARERPTLTHTSVFLLGLLSEFAFTSVSAHLSDVVQVLSASLGGGPQQDNKLQLCAIDALAQLLLSTKNPRELQGVIESALPSMLKAIETALSLGSVNEACESLGKFAQIAEKCFWALDAHLLDHVRALLAIVANTALEPQGRSVALEALDTIVNKRAKVIAKDAAVMGSLTRTLMLAQCMDDEWVEDWDDNEQLLEDDLFFAQAKGLRGSSITTLVSLAKHCGDDVQLLPGLFALLPELLASADWKQRFAALTTVGVLVEPKAAQMVASVTDVVRFVTPSFSDADPKVRYAAVACMSELLGEETLAPLVHNNYGQAILEELARLIDPASGSTPILLSCTCIALRAFCGSCKQTAILPFLDGFVAALVQCLSNAPVTVQEDAMQTLQALATLAGKEFGRFYDSLMPGIKQVISAGSNNTAALRSAAMCCVAPMAEAVGVDRFQADADQLMELLLLSRNNNDAEGAELEGLLEFSRRLCLVMKSRFAPYLPHVMPIIFKCCSSSEAGFKVEAADNATQETTVGADGQISHVAKVHGMAPMLVTANIWAMQLRQLALQAIDEISDCLGSDFAPYVAEATKVVVPCVGDTMNLEGSTTAADAAASLVFCVYKKLDDDLTSSGHVDIQQKAQANELLVMVVQALLTGLAKANEPSRSGMEYVDWRSSFAEGLERCLRISWQSVPDDSKGDVKQALLCPPLQLVPAWLEVMILTLKSGEARRMAQARELAEQGLDATDLREVMIELNDVERDCGEYVADSIGYLIKFHRTDMMGIFAQKLHPELMRWVSAQNGEVALRHHALCLYDDAIEFASPASHAFLGTCLPAMMQYMSDDDARVRQSALYGLNVTATHAPEAFAHVVVQVGTTLAVLIGNSGSNEAEMAGATENAVSALGRICRLHAQVPGVDINTWLPVWLLQLPLTVDEDEAQACHSLLCDYVESADAVVIGENGKHIPHIIKVFTSILVASDETETGATQNKLGDDGDDDDEYDGTDGDDDEEEEEDEAIEMADKATLARIPALLKALCGKANPQLLEQAKTLLSPAELAVWQRVMA